MRKYTVLIHVIIHYWCPEIRTEVNYLCVSETQTSFTVNKQSAGSYWRTRNKQENKLNILFLFWAVFIATLCWPWELLLIIPLLSLLQPQRFSHRKTLSSSCESWIWRSQPLNTPRISSEVYRSCVQFHQQRA